MLSQTTFEALQAVVGADRVSRAEAERNLHSRDQSDHRPHLPDAVIWPVSTPQVSAILALCHEQHLPVVGWGAGSSLEGNPIPVRGGLVVDFARMNQILTLHERDFQVVVQPGIFYKDMNRALARHGLFFAPDPGANASIGGMIANNAAGTRTVKYGATRDNVLALEVVLADGTVVRTGSRAVKQSAGYDLTHLFTGSEGTLGLITEATLKLAPLPAHFSAVTASFLSVADAARAVFEIIGDGLNPAALELLDAWTIALLNREEAFDLVESPNLFLEFHGASQTALEVELELVQAICRANGGTGFRAGLGRDLRDRLWEARHRLGEILFRAHPGQSYLITDVAVPISAYPSLAAYTSEIRDELQVEAAIFGHAGDGNLHTILFYASGDEQARGKAQQFNDRIVERALALHGTSTGEHGIGIGKQKYMATEHGPAALALMRQIKANLDPRAILNPGKVLALE